MTGIKDVNSDLAETIGFEDTSDQILAYNTDGTLNTITIQIGVNTFVQTYTYTNGLVTKISKWVKQ